MVFVRANAGRSFRAVRAETTAEQAHLSALPSRPVPALKRRRLADLEAALAGIGHTRIGLAPPSLSGPQDKAAGASASLSSSAAAGRVAIPFGISGIDACLAAQGLARGAVHEVQPLSAQDRTACVAFAAALLAHTMVHSRGPAVIVTSEAARRDFGALYGPGLFQFGLDPSRLIFLDAKGDLDALWAIEETLRADAGLAGMAALLGRSVTAVGRTGASAKGTHLADLTLSRRLTLAAAESATPLFLEVPPSAGFGSAAMTRWRIGPPPRDASAGFGAARDALFRRTRWRASLEKSRNGRTGEWTIEWDHAAHCFHMAAELAGDALAPGARESGPAGAPWTGGVVPFQARRFVAKA